MDSLKSVVFGIILLISSVSRFANALPENAFLIVHKKASTKRSKEGEEITVSFSIYNIGESTAYDVSLNDDNWPSTVFDVQGNKTVSWDKLEPGAKLSHSFLLKPKEKGLYQSPPAVVNFRVASKTDSQVAISTPIPELDVLSDKPLESQFLWELGIKFGPLISAVSIIVLVVWIVSRPQKPRKAKSGKKFR